MTPDPVSDFPGVIALSAAETGAPDLDALAAAVVALANTDGGAVVIDAADRVEAERWLRLAAARYTPPILTGAPELVEMPSGVIPLGHLPPGPALLIRVPRSPRVHALGDGQVMIYTAAGSRALNGDEIRALLSARSGGDFEGEQVPGARIADLDPPSLADFMLARVRRQSRQGDPRSREIDVPLIEMGAITPDYGVTVAGMLLFGRDPQRWLPHSGARFVRYVGSSNGVSPIFEREIGGPLVRVIEDLWELIRSQMRTSTASGELQYPAAAVHEALVNAACHRDYRLRSERITVSMFSEHLDITSPGGLPGFLTQTGHLLSHRYSRNPCLSQGLREWGYGGLSGQGMLRLVGQDTGYRPTEITARPYSVTVRFYAAGDPAPDDRTAPLTARQQIALDYVRARGSITLREFRTLCEGTASGTLQTDLSTLAAAGYLRKIGKASVYYILP